MEAKGIILFFSSFFLSLSWWVRYGNGVRGTQNTMRSPTALCTIQLKPHLSVATLLSPLANFWLPNVPLIVDIYPTQSDRIALNYKGILGEIRGFGLPKMLKVIKWLNLSLQNTGV